MRYSAGVIHPDAAIFEQYMDIAEICVEHRAYRDELEKSGVKTHTISELLLDKCRDKNGNIRQGRALDELKKLLESKGVEVVWLKLDNLKKGYGAAHCMIQVLWRQ